MLIEWSSKTIMKHIERGLSVTWTMHFIPINVFECSKTCLFVLLAVNPPVHKSLTLIKFTFTIDMKNRIVIWYIWNQDSIK